MTELQIGLLVIGVVVVAGVLAFNKWQERQYRRGADRSFGPGAEDVLMRGPSPAPAAAQERIEPALGPGEPELEPAPVPEDLEAQASSQPAREVIASEVRESAPPMPQPIAENLAILAQVLDFIVEMESAEAVSGAAVVEASAISLGGISKLLQWEGFNEAEQRWEGIRPTGDYAHLRAGLQLADRRGPLQPDELAQFTAGIHDVSAALGAVATAPDPGAALERAKALDAFCGDVDVQIALNLAAVSPSGIAGTSVRAFAEAEGFVLEQDGRYRKRDAQGLQLFALSGADGAAFAPDTMKALSVARLTLELDVPRAPGGLQTFREARMLAQRMARSLSASVEDDNRRALGDTELDMIDRQLQDLYQSMAGRGIPAGSRQALRLFS
jgi:FtsZ-interacting cell division protein ZipA